jgi:hypothetical protein
MPYYSLPLPLITVDVCDRYGLKQRAVWAGTTIEPDPSGGLRVLLHTRIDYYQPDASGGYGEPVPAGKGISSRNETLVADNNTAVYFNPADPADPRNGEALYFKEGGVIKVWGTRDANGVFTPLGFPIEDVPEPTTGQGDLFGVMMGQPIIMNDLVAQHITAANQPPYNRFA